MLMLIINTLWRRMRWRRRIGSFQRVVSLVICIFVAIAFSMYVLHSKLLSPHVVRGRTYSLDLSSLGCYDSYTNVEAKARNHSMSTRLRLDPRVLLVVETPLSSLGQQIRVLLEANRIKYKIEVANKRLPVLTNFDKGKYGVIIFENLAKYVLMDKWNRDLLDKYCREYGVGIIAFVHSWNQEVGLGRPVTGFPLVTHGQVRLTNYRAEPTSDVLRIMKGGRIFRGVLPGDSWHIFQPNHTTYKPIASAEIIPEYQDTAGSIPLRYPTVIHDTGRFDGIQRIFFGEGLSFWMHRLLLLDAISCFSYGRLSISLDRYVLIDIDDIFVGPTGTRMTPSDVATLLRTQEKFASIIPSFRFNLGFSGKYIHSGNPEEDAGDDMLIEYARKFTWFDHTFAHVKPHRYQNETALRLQMIKNKEFAETHSIPVDPKYAVAPHHSGVYPVHEELYSAWRHVWNTQVTSTEEYPHLRPAFRRRGFIHRNIMVLPRQTCGLFTHTIFLEKYPGGKAKLHRSIQGGELAQTIIFNRFNVFMTHLSNYGNDRLALYTFDAVFRWIRCWTNLNLHYVEPYVMAAKYFTAYPEERDPVWRNPCQDRRHSMIWSQHKSCENLPSLIVVGPQKTGTTALYTFLKMHPMIKSNILSPKTFEEVQFFSGANYYKGLDFYQTFFPLSNDTSSYAKNKTIYFEKSATYFDKEIVPMRVAALLPRAKIICILTSPIKRAYSWYQHMIAHGDPVARNFTFFDVITGINNPVRAVRSLRSRCLNPGLYSQHLERWLSFFRPGQIKILDGEQLKSDPVTVMNNVQEFIGLEHIAYEKYLKFDRRKGFYCQLLTSNRTLCLGKEKGRLYPPMEARAEKYLLEYYRGPNNSLMKLFLALGIQPPQWLLYELGKPLS